MDHSPGELEGEIDHLSRDAAVEYLLMPERVKKLEGQVEAVASNMEELNQLLKKLLGLGAESPSQDVRQTKRVSYVS